MIFLPYCDESTKDCGVNEMIFQTLNTLYQKMPFAILMVQGEMADLTQQTAKIFSEIHQSRRGKSSKESIKQK